jgi:tetratricopeptide (TPR) repeat protein
MDFTGKEGIQMSFSFFQGRSMKIACLFLAASFLAQAYLSSKLSRWVHPVALESQGYAIEKNVPSTFRAVAFLSGFRLLASHTFWIQILLYYGDTTNSADRYSKMYSYCSLATDLNPHFIPTYQFGAAVLAFHVKRIDEAVRLLQKGIAANPPSKTAYLKVLMAAIAYQNAGNYDAVIPGLEALINSGDAPAMMVNILANTYQKVGRMEDAIRLWQKILKATDDQGEKIEAAQKLQGLYQVIKGKKN